MTEEEATNQLINLTKEYMKNPRKERLKKYDEYISARRQINDALRLYIAQQKESDGKIK